MIILFYLIIGLIPGLFWLWFYWLKDRKRPEPLGLLAKVFFFGMLATIPAIIVEVIADSSIQFSVSEDTVSILVGMFLVVAPIEEYVKYMVVKKFVYDKNKFNEAFDGITYAIVASLGFASFENVLSVFTHGVETLALRFVTATLLHALTAGVIGYFLGLAKFNKEREKELIAEGLISAIVIHGVYNFILATKTQFTLPLIIVMLGLVFLMVREGILQMKQRDDRVLGL